MGRRGSTAWRSPTRTTASRASGGEWPTRPHSTGCSRACVISVCRWSRSCKSNRTSRAPFSSHPTTIEGDRHDNDATHCEWTSSRSGGLVEKDRPRRGVAVRDHLRHVHRREVRLLPAAVRGRLRRRRGQRHAGAVGGAVRDDPHHRQHRHCRRTLLRPQAAAREPRPRLRHRTGDGVRVHRSRHPQCPHPRDDAAGLRGGGWGRGPHDRRCTRSSPCRSGRSCSAPGSSSVWGTG